MRRDPPGLDYDFALDRFQIEAIEALRAGQSVLVAAPTGSGKTVVAEYAIADALALGQRVFYTAPIKALSNQKYRDLVARHGVAMVGLLTGDNAVNPDAPVVVMTTEVLRNMIYAGSHALDGLRYVILDEVHYLQDTYRGSVWEEVIIHLPRATRLVCLSATVSNATELGEWLTAVRGPTTVVVETRRPVELVNLFMVADRHSDQLHLIPTLIDDRPNPEGQRFTAIDPRRSRVGSDPQAGRRDRGRPRHPFVTPWRVDVVERLAAEDLLPAIYFIFSRAGCDEAVRFCLNAHLKLTQPGERETIRAIVEERTAALTDSDLDVLGYDEWLEGLERGFAAHHAGMVPPFKETVEVLFTAGLVKVVFATETLALGINMPARTVVIEKLSKFTGEQHEFLTAGEYTQLTGRAGRRGIDERGHAVVLWSPFATFQQVADLALSRSFVLRSSFRPTYNMAANLVRRYDPEHAHALLNRSFAQFQTDRAVVLHEERILRRRADIARLRELLDGSDESTLASDGDDERAHSVADDVAALRPGDVVTVPGNGERAAVLSVAQRKRGAVRVRLITATDTVTSLSDADFDEPPVVVGSIDLPIPFAPGNRAFQHEVALRVRRARATGPSTRRAAAQRARARRQSPDQRRLQRAAEQLRRAEREVADLERRIATRGESLARRFDDVLGVLESRGYVDGWALTPKGELLVRIFHESDLLIAEAIASGLFDGVDVASFAGIASSFVYEHRSPTPPPAPWFPTKSMKDRFDSLLRITDALNAHEIAARLPPTRRPDATFFALAHAWASGEPLERVLDDEDISGGDFVRTTKQLIDVLRQLGDTALSPATSRTARAAANALARGVVAISGAIDEAEPFVPAPPAS
ncbi:MAG: DEAD/DEAH box helicase [Actinobacteria bacterium]|nr:MAG: DEAD/DEAH box helicase [Actinomycetota bacterium]